MLVYRGVTRGVLVATTLALGLLGGCKDDPAPAPESDDTSTGAPPPAFDFQPSNIDLEPLYDVAEVVIDRDCEIGGGQLCDATGFEYFDFQQADGSMIGVYVVEDLHITVDADVTVSGDRPIAIAAQRDMLIEGRLYVAPGENGGAETSAGEVAGNGAGAGSGIDGPVTGGGGGGFCGPGGNHGDGGGAGGTYGNAQVVPLIGGSSGGERNSGGGGGALQLIAGNMIEVDQTVTVPGAGGEDGGGGSGGALLIEAPMVVISGRVSANGGGGASGDKSDGVEGRDRADPAAGGQGDGTTPGGEGSAADVVEGQDGTSNVMTSQEFGSGGGGAGWIRINTASGEADTRGSVSPSFESGCASIGTLG